MSKKPVSKRPRWQQQKRRPRPATPKIILFNKPFLTLCQFSGEPHDSLLKDFIPIPDVYPAGRLDKDSEGLLLLTNNGIIQARITQPKQRTYKSYWVLVEGEPSEESLAQLRQGVELKDGQTLPARAEVIDAPDLWQRIPPVRVRKSIHDTWLNISICEGRNRQVRRMTAAIGHPTLRLVRHQIGSFQLNGLQPGEYKELSLSEIPPELLPARK
ncbi:pseudouridine synthase [Aliidiomarina taiwanensis]|uniref:pseudouridine synthase n=1 Tax=Aliidiomarina taiwanensis TaxID=946228 RepID=UPI00269BB094